MKKIISIIVSLLIMLAVMPVGYTSGADLTLKAFNATRTVVTVDFNNVSGTISSTNLKSYITLQKLSNGTLSNVSDFAVTTTTAQSGTVGGSSGTTAEGNTIIITPTGGIDTDSLYRVKIAAGMQDTGGNSVASEISTGWFRVNQLFYDDFNVQFEEDGTTLKYPYYYGGNSNSVRSYYWNASYRDFDSGHSWTGIAKGKYENVVSRFSEFQFGNTGQYAFLNYTGLPEAKTVSDYTVEYELGLPELDGGSSPHFLLMREPPHTSRYFDTGYMFVFDNANYSYNSGAPRGDVVLKVNRSTELAKITSYNFGTQKINVRVSTIGNNLQWFIGDNKLFDITNNTVTTKGTVEMCGSARHDGNPYTTVDNVSLTNVITYGDFEIDSAGLSYSGFNATKTVITADFDHVNGSIDSTGLADKITVYKRTQNGTNQVNFTVSTTENHSGTVGGSAGTTANGNTVIITPQGGVDTNAVYKVDFASGIKDIFGFALSSDATTGWFGVKQLFFDDFNAGNSDEALTEPYYVEVGMYKDRYWDASYRAFASGSYSDSGYWTGLGDSTKNGTSGNKFSKFQFRNTSQTAIINKTGLPNDKQVADYTIEYKMGLPYDNNSKKQFVSLRNSSLRTRNDPLNYLNGGYMLGLDGDYSYSSNRGSLFLRIGNIDNSATLQVSSYSFGSHEVAVRAVLDGNHMQYYIDNDKLFDYTDSTYEGVLSTVGFVGACTYNQDPYPTIDDVSITTVTRYTDTMEITDSTVTVDGTTVNLAVTVADNYYDSTNYVTLVGLYDSGDSLIAFGKADESEAVVANSKDYNFTFTNKSGYHHMRIFVWDNINDINYLAPCIYRLNSN